MIADWYLWIKAVHIMSVIAWMAGLFYLPRLFVYHSEKAQPGTELSETLKIMERKLFRVIMGPARIAVFVLGLFLVFGPFGIELTSDFWLHAKFVLVLILAGFHDWLGARVRAFAKDQNTFSGRTFRIANEVPTVLMAAIVILAVVKPF